MNYNTLRPSSSPRKSANGTPTETEKFRLKFNTLDSQNEDNYPNKTASPKSKSVNSPKKMMSYLFLWKEFTQKIMHNYKRTKLKKEHEKLQRQIEQLYQENLIASKNQLSPTFESSNRYYIYQNDAVQQPHKRKQFQNYRKADESSTITPKFLITTISSNRRSNSVQSRKNQQQQMECRNVNTNSSGDRKKLRIRKLWETLAQNLRRSKQRIVLFHSSRKIHLRRVWKSLIVSANRQKRIFDLKVKVFRVSVQIVNQLFLNNRIKPIPASYVSKQLLFQLRSSSITSVLTYLLRLYYNRRISKEKGTPLSISFPCTNFSLDFDTIISHTKMFNLIREAFLNSPIKICENDIDDHTADEIIPVLEFDNETISVSGNPDDILSNLIRLTRRDIRLIVNDRIVSDLVQNVYDKIYYPITLNMPDEAAIRSMVSNLTIEDSLPFLPPPNVDSIFDISTKDDRVYVNQRMIDSEINRIMSQIHLPIEQNTVSDLTSREIVEEDVFDDVIESEFAIPYVNNDLEYSNNKSSLIKMLNYSSVDVRMYFSGTFVDDLIDDLYDQISIEFPIESNRPSDKTCREIIDIDEYNDLPFGDYIENKREVTSWVDPVDRYEAKDIKLYVNQRFIGTVIGQLYGEIVDSLPIVPNDVDEDEVSEILSMPIEDSLKKLPVCKNRCIDNYKAKDIQLYINNRVIDNVLNGLYSIIQMPIVPNKVSQKQVNEILEDDFIDVYGIYSNAEEWIDPLMNVDPNNRKIQLDDRVVLKTIKNLRMKVFSEMPIVPNTVDDETVSEILDCTDINCDQFEKSCFFSIDNLVDVSGLMNIEATDIRMYVCKRDIDEMIDTIFDETEIPLQRNEVDQSAIEEIVNDGIEDVFNGLPLDFSQPIGNYKPKDIQLYVNDRIVDNFMGRIYETVNLPLVENLVNQSDIDEILEEEDYGDVVPPISERYIEESLYPLCFNFDPCERKINFNDFPISAKKFAYEALIKLPLESNDVTESEVEMILNYLDDKTTFINRKSSDNSNGDDDVELSSVLPLANADCLKRYVAPVEVFESVDDVVERLMNRILVTEIFPSMPVERQAFVDNQTANAILSMLSKRQPNSVLIDDKSIFNLIMTEPKPVLDIEPLKDFDIPEEPVPGQTPDDILNGILWEEILNHLPIVPKKQQLIDFRDVVDTIVIDNYVADEEEASFSSDSDKKSTKSNKSAAADLICKLLTDSYSLTSPSNPPSPVQQNQQLKSYLDTSSESLSNSNADLKKILKSEIDVNEIVVDDKENDLSASASASNSAVVVDSKINVESVIIEEEEEECEIIDDFEEEKIEKIEKIENEIALSDDDAVDVENIESNVVVKHEINEIVEHQIIVEEEDDEEEVEFEFDIDFDVEANGDQNENENENLDSVVLKEEEEDKISDLLSDDFE